LGIEIFDNTEYDPRTSCDWLMLRAKENGKMKPVSGKALLPIVKAMNSDSMKSDEKRPSSSPSLKQGTHNVGLFDRPVSVASSNCEKQEKQFEWAEVGMLDYNEEKQLYLVRRMVWPKAGGGQTVDRKGPLPPTSFTQANPKTGCTGDNLHYWVPRVRLMFAAEDPVNFANRVEFAYRFRAKTEALIRYHLYIDCMPTDGVRELERGSLKRMINSACSSPVLKQSAEVIGL
jgi:dynein heavy chain